MELGTLHSISEIPLEMHCSGSLVNDPFPLMPAQTLPYVEVSDSYQDSTRMYVLYRVPLRGWTLCVGREKENEVHPFFLFERRGADRTIEEVNFDRAISDALSRISSVICPDDLS